jgi:hypothetical protein
MLSREKIVVAGLQRLYFIQHLFSAYLTVVFQKKILWNKSGQQ